jgi:hypothetical protein
MSERDRTAVGKYVRAVERWWSELCERPSILSPREWTLVERWHQREIPLQVIREAIEAAAERLRKPGAAAPKSLAYLAPAVEESWRVVLEGRIAPPTDVPRGESAARGIAAWRSAASAAGSSSPLGGLLETLLALLEEGAAAEEAEQRLEGAILEAAPAEERAAVRGEIETELAPYRRRMSAEEYESTLRKASVRRLRIRLKLPGLDPPGPGEESPV